MSILNKVTVTDQIEPRSGWCQRGQLRDSSQLFVYAENTTIHGIKYLGDRKRPIIEKIFWIVIFAVCFLFLGFFVQDVVKKFNQNSAILVEDERPTPIYSIPFPAVTICPAVKIKSEFLPAEFGEKWLSEVNESMALDLAYLICNQKFLNVLPDKQKGNRYGHLNQSHIELLRKISPTLLNIFSNVKFAEKREFSYEVDTDGEVYIATPFSDIITNEGICFTFNVPSEIIADDPSLQTEYKFHNIQNKTKSWDKHDGYSGYPRFPRTVWGSGPGSGLYLILTAHNPDLYTFCQPTQLGYKILLHSPDEYPTTLEKFIAIPHNTLSQIKVTPIITKTSNDLANLIPEVRQCFFDYERKLKYFTFYNRLNCRLECLANYTLQQYGCVHFSLPRNISQPICGSSIKLRQLYDAEEIINSYFEYKTKINKEYAAELDYDEAIESKKSSNFHCNCLPACNSVEYEYSVEMETMESAKITERYSPKSKHAEPATVMLDIFFGVTKVTGKTRKQFYTFSDLISNLGGLVGLFLGASVLSIFEIIYFLIVR